MTALYRRLLRLYPADYCREFGSEMLDVLSDADADAAARGLVRHSLFRAREVSGLIRGALDEQLHRFAGAHLFAPRRFTMRSNFRYPVATVVFMVLSFLGAVLAIYRAGAIVEATTAHPGLAATLYSIPRGALVLFIFCWIMAAVVCAILFALRRSGVHRLSEAQTWPQK